LSRENQDFGQVAKKFLSNFIYEKTVEVKETGVYRYGRTIGIVIINSVNVNEDILKAGLCWHYKKYDNNPYWAELENKARIEKKGLWSMPNIIPPWEYRKL
jgi:micrococcal nuclease